MVRGAQSKCNLFVTFCLGTILNSRKIATLIEGTPQYAFPEGINCFHFAPFHSLEMFLKILLFS